MENTDKKLQAPYYAISELWTGIRARNRRARGVAVKEIHRLCRPGIFRLEAIPSCNTDPMKDLALDIECFLPLVIRSGSDLCTLRLYISTSTGIRT